MKKITILLLSALLVLSLAACGNRNQNTVEDTPAEMESMVPATEPAGSSSESTAEAGSGNILIAYFSVMETDGADTV